MFLGWIVSFVNLTIFEYLWLFFASTTGESIFHQNVNFQDKYKHICIYINIFIYIYMYTYNKIHLSPSPTVNCWSFLFMTIRPVSLSKQHPSKRASGGQPLHNLTLPWHLVPLQHAAHNLAAKGSVGVNGGRNAESWDIKYLNPGVSERFASAKNHLAYIENDFGLRIGLNSF